MAYPTLDFGLPVPGGGMASLQSAKRPRKRKKKPAITPWGGARMAGMPPMAPAAATPTVDQVTRGLASQPPSPALPVNQALRWLPGGPNTLVNAEQGPVPPAAQFRALQDEFTVKRRALDALQQQQAQGRVDQQQEFSAGLPWMIEHDVAPNQVKGRSPQDVARSIGVAREVDGMFPTPPQTYATGAGFSRRSALPVPAETLQRQAEAAQRMADDAGSAASRNIRPDEPGYDKDAVGYFPPTVGSARDDPAYWEYIKKSKQYIADRNAGKNAQHPGPLRGRPSKEAIKKRDDYLVKKSAERREKRDAKPSRAVRMAMVTQKAQGKPIDIDVARAQVLEKLGKAVPDRLAKRLDDRRRARMGPAALAADATRRATDVRAEHNLGTRNFWDRQAKSTDIASQRESLQSALNSAVETLKMTKPGTQAWYDAQAETTDLRKRLLSVGMASATSRQSSASPEPLPQPATPFAPSPTASATSDDLPMFSDDMTAFPPQTQTSPLDAIPTKYRNRIRDVLAAKQSSGNGDKMREVIKLAQNDGANIPPDLADQWMRDATGDWDATIASTHGEFIPGTGEGDRFIKRFLPFWPAYNPPRVPY